MSLHMTPLRWANYGLQAVFAHLIIAVFALMSADKAARLGSMIAGTIGPKLAANRKVIRHIRKIWPDMNDEKVNRIARGMWENLGRVVAEYPHLQTIARTRCDLIGLEHADAARNQGKNLLFVGGHMANWEMCAAKYHTVTGDSVALIYREPNNPLVASLLHRLRTHGGKFPAVPKSRTGNRLLLETFKQGQSIGLLIDQKYNEGEAVPFLGFPAMTSTAFVSMAQKYNYALLPMHSVRQDDGRYILHIQPPIPLVTADGTARAAVDVTEDVHSHLEQWIIERPEQWLWLHRRWSSKAVVDLPRIHPISEPS